MATVLIIDDDDAVLEVTAALLASGGYTVLVEPRSAAAVSRVLHDAPDVVLLDVMMPGMTAVEIMVSLSRVAHHPPVLLYTAILPPVGYITPGGEEFYAQMVRLGIVGAVPKTGDRDVLLQAIADTLAGLPPPMPGYAAAPCDTAAVAAGDGESA